MMLDYSSTWNMRRRARYVHVHTGEEDEDGDGDVGGILVLAPLSNAKLQCL